MLCCRDVDIGNHFPSPQKRSTCTEQSIHPNSASNLQHTAHSNGSQICDRVGGTFMCFDVVIVPASAFSPDKPRIRGGQRIIHGTFSSFSCLYYPMKEAD